NLKVEIKDFTGKSTKDQLSLDDAKQESQKVVDAMKKIPEEIILGDGSGLSITHTGSSKLNYPPKTFHLDNVLYSPQLNKNLISVAKFCKTNQSSVEFFPSYFIIKDLRTGAPLLRGKNSNDIYYAPSCQFPEINVTAPSSVITWHNRLGHPSTRILSHVLSSQNLCASHSTKTLSCNACFCNKSHKLPFGTNSLVSTAPLQLVYTDVWGPCELSVDKFRYYVIFVDHFSKYTWLYPMHKKSDVSILFPKFKSLVEKYFQLPLISLYSDNG
ncbi:MAG: hypothetical protein Q8829_02745, partial [Candidatus Phytoplasma australasiaticum]|nr:hypothetical protein [Candidatus Phytoplasma australasiaticum]